MLIRSKRQSDCAPSEITPEQLYVSRRRFLAGGAATAVGLTAMDALAKTAAFDSLRSLAPVKASAYSTAEERTPVESVTSYNNFYEFGLDKEDPAEHAQTLKPRPWSLVVDGEVMRPQTFDVDDLIANTSLEERVYRLRCVEAWSMVVPWIGFPLAEILRRVEPTSKAKYVAFETLFDPKQMPGQKSNVLNWPYREGLRLDEAMNPLTLMAVGLYGRVLPNQNGAPIRLVVPWKYGFKSIKSIVRITCTEKQPRTAWNASLPDEYGFYANVNPTVDHPRWSQAKERRIGDFLHRETLMFNGYGDEVANLYAGMDLKRYF